MGLLKKLTFKIKKPKEFVFENFKENFESNQVFYVNEYKKMRKGFKVIEKRESLNMFFDEMADHFDDFMFDIMELTNSENFAINLVDIVYFAKSYAINYVASEAGKYYKEIIYACDRLESMIDCMNFNYLCHINFETPYEAEYKDNKFIVTKNDYTIGLLNMVNEINFKIMMIKHALRLRDNSAAFKLFSELSDKDLYKFKYESEEIFGL